MSVNVDVCGLHKMVNRLLSKCKRFENGNCRMVTALANQ